MEKNEKKSIAWYEKTWIVIVLCIVFFPIGLYALWKNSTIRIGWKIAVTSFIAFIIIIGYGNDDDKASKNSTDKQTTEKKLDIIFDIPSLDGKNIDEIISILGKPTTNSEPTKLQLKVGIDVWQKYYIKDGYELLITYNPETRDIIDFFIATKDSSGASSDYNDLLQISNTKEGLSQIFVEPTKSIQYPELFTGIKILFKSSIEKEKANKLIKWNNSKAGKIQKKHPDWTNEECERISQNKVWIGMTLEMLIYERGKPNSANPSNYGNGINWQWCWYDCTPSCFYGGEDQIITSYN